MWALEVVGPSSIAGALTAFFGMLTAGILLVNVMIANRTKRVVDTVHTIVNQRFTDQQRYIMTLQKQLIDNELVPAIDQSQPILGMPDAHPGQPQ